MAYSCVTFWHKLSCCVVHWPVECIHTISTHRRGHTEACFAQSRRDIESSQPSPTRCHRAPHHTCVPPKQSTLASQRTIGAECSSCRAISWRNMFFDKRTLFTLSSRGVQNLIEVVSTLGLASDTASHVVWPTSTLVKKGHGLDLDTDDPLMMYEVVSVMHRRYLEYALVEAPSAALLGSEFLRAAGRSTTQEGHLAKTDGHREPLTRLNVANFRESDIKK